MSTPFGQLDKFSEQMKGVTTKEFQQLLDSGYFPLLKKAARELLTLPSQDDFSYFLGLSQQPKEQEEKCLRFNTCYHLQPREAFEPDTFYQKHQGLFVWDVFREFVLQETKSVAEVPGRVLASSELMLPSLDSKIMDELLLGSVFDDASLFLAYLADMLESQWVGAEGPLLTDGGDTLAYVAAMDQTVVIRVKRVQDEWHLYMHPWGVNEWSKGSRILSPFTPIVGRASCANELR